MKKKRGKYFGETLKCRFKVFRLILFFVASTFYASQLQGQQVTPKLTLEFRQASFSEVVESIRQQIHYEFVFNSGDVQSLNRITLSLKDASLQKILDVLLKDSNLEYVIEQKTVVIKKRTVAPTEAPKSILLKGIVTDHKHHPLPGVTLRIEGTNLGTSTDAKGEFVLNIKIGRAHV